MQTLWRQCLLTSMFLMCYIGERQRKRNCGHIINEKCSKCILLKGWCWWCMLLRSNFVEPCFHIVEREVCFASKFVSWWVILFVLCICGLLFLGWSLKRREKEMEAIKLCFYVHCCCEKCISSCVLCSYLCCVVVAKLSIFFWNYWWTSIKIKSAFNCCLKWVFFYKIVHASFVMVCCGDVGVIYCHDPRFGLTIKVKA
jgi:hypothetical protein